MTFYDYIKELTKVYQANADRSPAMREAKCIAVTSRFEFTPIQDGDLLAGRKQVVPVGFSNEPLLGRSVCWFYDRVRAAEALEAEGATAQQIEEVNSLLDFWSTLETRALLRSEYPEDIRETMPEDIYWEHSQVAFPLYRVVGAYMDYDKLLRLGLGGMKQLLEQYRQRDPSNNLYDACLIALDSLTDVCLRYADQARARGQTELAEALQHISQQPPGTFLEAMQLAWLYSLISGVLNYGRMDDYLGDFLQRDLDSGKITPQQALDLICSLWRLIDARKTVFHGRVIIGGKGRHNELAADQFALLAIEASGIVAEAEPQLSLRFYEGQNKALMDKALEVIGTGCTYPMLYCDDVNIPSVQKAFGISREEAQDYVFFGCGEYVVNKKSIGSPNGIINLLKALEITIFDGWDLRDRKAMGLKLGNLDQFDSFDAFYAAYKTQLEHYFRILARQQQMEYDICARSGAFLFITMLMDDCLERGKALCDGGVQYLGGTLETYGNINTANSLFAIKDVVFDRKLITPKRLMQALEADFEGFETERRLLLQAHKYGNDWDDVDALAADLHEFVCQTVRDLKNITRMHSYLVVIINNEANTILGRFTAASADGRKAYTPMANANNPVGGTDVTGVTAMLNSLVKLRTDIHAGAVQNMAFSREFFCDNRAKLEAVLTAYFRNGGQQAMINVLGRGDLLAAIENPQAYPNLMVRVGGFSARFVTLSPDVQREIASRTLY